MSEQPENQAQQMLGVVRLLDSPWREKAIKDSYQYLYGYGLSDMYLAITEGNPKPPVSEIKIGYMKDLVTMVSREIVEFSDSSKQSFSADIAIGQRVGIMFLAFPVIMIEGLLGILSRQRKEALAFSIFHMIAGTRLAAPKTTHAIQYTEMFRKVEIQGLVQSDKTILMSITYGIRETAFTSSDPNAVGQYKTMMNFTTQEIA